MIKVVGVKFREKGKIYHFDTANLQLSLGDDVVVETERGVGYAKVYTMPRFILKPFSGRELKKVLKKATEDDLLEIQNIRNKEKEAFSFCLEKIVERDIQMKLIDVECLQDGSKIIFYFTADGRIDFRELVKDLASKFKTRIEMRQIGVRDEARMINGYGPCGRQLCCAAFLREFEPVSIKMAKEQSMVLNPAKISGICGRLMCCIGYEAGNGESCKKKPRVETEGIAPKTEEIISEQPLPTEEKEKIAQQAKMETTAPAEHKEAVKSETRPIEQAKEAVKIEAQQQAEKPSQPQAQKPESFREKRGRRRHRKKHKH